MSACPLQRFRASCVNQRECVVCCLGVVYQPEYSVPFTSTDTVMLAFPLVEMLRDMSCGFSSAETSERV